MAAHPYEAFLHLVQKPARYVGGEHGERRKDWDAVSCRMCLAFPDLYEVGMSHLGYKILYGVLNAHDRLLAERAYAPWDDMERELRARGEPLRSLESARPLSDFDVVGFSLQYELTFTNVLLMLDLGGVPRRGHQRGERDPLVVCGGPTATHAEAMSPFVDAFLIGDGEEKTPELMLTWAALRDAGVPRDERLAHLARLGGLYVPSRYRRAEDASTGFHVVTAAIGDAPLPVERTFLSSLADHPMPHDGPVATTETIFDRVSIEVARGCTEGCRFCQAGMIYRPVRERDPQEIIDTIVRAVEEGGYDEASLTSLSTADYSAISPLVRRAFEELGPRRVGLGVSSLRAYGLGEEVLDAMTQSRATGLTFAPEAGTQRMRDVINKNVTEEQLLETAERVFRRGWSKMKLYFMIGLPTETDEDVRGIVQTGDRALAVGRAHQKGRARVTVSVSTHVPKPHTPFQWCAMDGWSEVVRKQDVLRDEARSSRVALKVHASRGSWLEGLLARGDARMADVVEAAYEAGARFDSWDERLDVDAWKRALEQAGVDVDRRLGTLPTSGRLPWDHIDVGLEDGFLAREYRKAVADRLSPPCGKAAGMFVHHTSTAEAEPDTRKLVCYDCGVACDLTSMRQERLVYLRRLGAHEPVAATAEDRAVVRPEDRRPMVGVDQGRPGRLRVRYTKLGRLAYGSHLDLVRLLPRLFRRAGLPLFYTRGFHPKPAMSFGPALPVGVSGLGEWVDVKLCLDAIDHAELSRRVAALRSLGQAGLEVTGARLLEPAEPSITKALSEAVYVAGLPAAARAALGLDGEDALRARVEAARSGGDLRVRRTVKGIGREIDVGAYLLDVDAGAGGEALDRAGLAGDLLPLRFTLAVSPNGSARPTEALEALLGPGVHAPLVRAELRGRSPSGRVVDPIAPPRPARGGAAAVLSP